MKKFVFAAALGLLAAPVLADGIHTRDLGAGGTGDECLARAERAIRAYIRSSNDPSPDVSVGDWSASGFNLQPGNVDAQIACPYRDNISSIVLLFTHSSGEQSEREAVALGIRDAWNADTGPRPTK